MAKQTLDIDGFTIIRRLGTGARSTIYLAKDDLTGEQVALKRALMETAEDARIFEQIETEFKVSRLVDNTYIRKCHKLLKKRRMLKTSELLMSMEYFEGQSLEESPGLSLGDVLLVFRMVAVGLNAMHQKGLVHCDIKPNNILIGPHGHIKIIDLGQSCRIGTVKTRIQGTPDYIAPEQVHRQHIGHRTDIFNLGATMYWAMTGKNVPTLIPRKNEFGMPMPVERDFKTPNQIHSRIPREISDLVVECVSEKPSSRPSSMSEIVSRLDVTIRKIFGNRIEKNAATSN